MNCSIYTAYMYIYYTGTLSGAVRADCRLFLHPHLSRALNINNSRAPTAGRSGTPLLREPRSPDNAAGTWVNWAYYSAARSARYQSCAIAASFAFTPLAVFRGMGWSRKHRRGHYYSESKYYFRDSKELFVRSKKARRDCKLRSGNEWRYIRSRTFFKWSFHFHKSQFGGSK